MPLKEQIQRAATEEKCAKGAGEEDIFGFLTDNVRRAYFKFLADNITEYCKLWTMSVQPALQQFVGKMAYGHCP